MARLTKIFCLLTFLLFAASAGAQTEEVEMADALHANGMIYVIVAIVLIVLAGLVFYLFLLDRKIGRLERDLDDKNQRNQITK